MDNLYFPAEWQSQCFIQLTWPHAGTDWAYCLDEITETFIQMSEAITRYEPLLVVTPDTKATHDILAARLTPKAIRWVTLFECPTNDTWARDHGPLTLQVIGGGEHARLLDFKFNGWGCKFPAELDNAISSRLALAGLLPHPLEDHNDFVLEGGSVESDGCGTIFTTSSCLLAPHRNQPMDRDEIERQLLRRLHAQRVVWLDHGILAGDDTDGHIDTIVRCASNDKLLYVRCDNKDDEHYEDFKALQRQLLDLRTLKGKPYQLLPLPMPDAIYEEGFRLPATYANFVILNGGVLVPTYGQPANDEWAIQTIARAFPGREVIPIDATTVIRQHGSLHCLTMQYH